MKRSVQEFLTILSLVIVVIGLLVWATSIISSFVFIPIYVNFFADCNCAILFFAKIAAITTSALLSIILFLFFIKMTDII